jgi:DNA-binding NtrC family response regulator
VDGPYVWCPHCVTASRDPWDADGRERIALPLKRTERGALCRHALWSLMMLRDAGYDVASFRDSMSALGALEMAKRVELLVTCVHFPAGQPNGVALGRMTRVKRPDVQILFIAQPETEEHTEGIGEFLALSVSPSDIVDTVRQMLASQP